MRTANIFAEDHLQQAMVDNIKTRKNPILIKLHRRWSELLDDENCIIVLSSFDWNNRFELIGNVKFKGKEYSLFKSLIKDNSFVIGEFTEKNEFDDNNFKFQCVWNNLF